MRILGVLFDFDGIVIDSEDADRCSWSEEFNHAGVPISAQQYATFWHGWAWTRETRMIDHLEALVGEPVDRAAIEARRLARYTELCAVLPARPGIRDWIIGGHAMGLKLGVATNDDTGRATKHLSRLPPGQRSVASRRAVRRCRCPSATEIAAGYASSGASASRSRM